MKPILKRKGVSDMTKYKRQRVYSKTNGMRHRMIYMIDDKSFIKTRTSLIPVEWISKDVWRVL